MYYGCTKEVQDKATRSFIKQYRDAAALYPQIKNVIQEFDGKVFNKRLQTALQDRTGARVYVENRPNMIDIHIYGSRGEWVTLAILLKDDMEAGKRINAGKLIESLTDHRTHLLKKAAEYEEQIEQIEQVKEQIRQIDKQLKAVLAPFDCTIRDIYGINKRLY